MSFTQSIFIAFCAFVYPVYFLLARRIRWRNIFILVMSYLFYGWWDWRFLALIIGTSCVDYRVAIAIDDSADPARKRRFLLVSLISNLGVLGFFKYFNFFVQTLSQMLDRLGFQAHAATLAIILPIGVSFYTFQAISYVVDVYRGQVRAERDPSVFFTFVAYFPQLLSGPIERAGHMLPQFRHVRVPSREEIGGGIWLIIYGYFTKMVVADTLAPWVNLNFQANQMLGWSTILSTVAFGLQIYGDFKGYSMIAKGLAALMGFDLMWNFKFPYWSGSIREFWHCWHISLSAWLRDYLYIPLGGSRASPSRVCSNLMLTFILGGLWHGAGLNFLLWGGWHGSALCVNYLYRRRFADRGLGALGWIMTMVVVFVGWFFFRATDYSIWRAMLASLANMQWLRVHTAMLEVICLLAAPVALLEYVEIRNKRDPLAIARLNTEALLAIETVMLALIFVASQRATVDFIYFKF